MSNEVKAATRLLNAFRWSFEQEFEHDAIEIERCRSEVEEEIKLATAQAVMRTQQLVQLKAQNSKKSDESLSRFRQETTTKLDNLREMQLLRDEQAASELCFQKRVKQHLIFTN